MYVYAERQCCKNSRVLLLYYLQPIECWSSPRSVGDFKPQSRAWPALFTPPPWQF